MCEIYVSINYLIQDWTTCDKIAPVTNDGNSSCTATFPPPHWVMMVTSSSLMLGSYNIII